MGTWGVSIFADDLASEVRDNFRDLVAEGKSPAEATEILHRQYKETIADKNDSAVFWLSLAATQWELGRLEQSVKKKALEILDKGADLETWLDDPKSFEKRKAVLASLRNRLLTPPPQQKKLRKTDKSDHNYEIGEALSYKLKSGDLALFRVIGHHLDKGGKFAVVELLDWKGKEAPGQEEIAKLAVRKEANARGYSQFMLGAAKAKERDRITRIGIKTTPAQTPEGYAIFPSKYLDQLLESVFGIA
jgi:hypothetical protein